MRHISLLKKVFGISLLLLFSNAGFSQLTVGTIPKGDSIVIRHDVTIITNPPAGTTHIAAQWTVQGSNFSNFLSDDPDTGAPLDSTITPIQLCLTSTMPTIQVLHNPLCPGSPDTLIIAGGVLGDGTHWQWYTGSCGGTAITAHNASGDTLIVSPSVSTTYFVRGEGGCVSGAPCASVTIEMLVVSAPTITQPTCSIPSGTIVVNANVGTSVLEYRLNGGSWQTSNIFSSLAAGTYNIEVRNQGVTGCLAGYSGNPVTINTAPVTPTINPVSNQTVCNNASTTAVIFSGSPAGTVFNWNNNTPSIGLAASGSGDIAAFNAVNTGSAPVTATITITPQFTNAGGTCNGTPATFTITVNPTPVAAALPSSQSICSGNAITTMVLSSATAGTIFSWTRDNTGTVTGISSSGSGDISGTLTNTTTSPITVTFTITPVANGCSGLPITATVTVNPGPAALAIPSSQTICSGTAISTIVLSSATPAVTYNWTRDNTGIVTGIAASGSGDINGVLTNTTTSPITVTFTITPTAAGCTGPSITATVLVNPTPVAIATPASQTICSGTAITTIALSSATAGTTFAWTRDNAGIVTGIAANGSGDISGALMNTTANPVTVTFTISPTANSCPGTPIIATVLVNPAPVAIATPSSQTICSGTAITTITLSSATAGTAFVWTRDNTGTVTGIAPNGSGNISGTLMNTTVNPVTVTFTITPIANGCAGTSITATVLVNPTPVAIATPSSQTICSGTAINTIMLSSLTAGTAFTWTRDNNATVTGIAASGSGSISGSLTNTSPLPVTVTFTIIPSASGCNGTPITATVLVNPTPVGTATPPSQTICSGAAITTIVSSSATPGATFAWTRDNNAAITGIAANGSGNISGSLMNTTTSPVTVTFTITPSANGCNGIPITATVLVNPIPDAVATPSSQTTCSGQTITTIVLTSSVAGTTFNWTRDNTGSVTGIAGSGSGNISGVLTNTTASPITVSFAITPTANGCNGTPIISTVLVNPTPDATATPVSQTICSGSSITPIVLTGTVPGTIFNWVRNNTVTVTGIAGSGSGNINGALTNTTNAPVSVMFTITPTAFGCTPGTPITATVLVNPTAIVNIISNQSVCNNTSTAAVNFTSPTTGGTIVYNWTNTNTAIGLGASGTGNIPSFVGTNAGAAPISGTITVTPTYTNGISCTGTPITFTITVNPIPNAVATPSSQTICNGTTMTPIVLSGNVTGTTFNWTRNNTVTVTGIAGSGSGNISGILTNTTNAPVTVTFTITPFANGCAGASVTATVLVNPTATVNTVVNQTLCNGANTTAVNFSSPQTGGTIVYNWTNNNTSIGLAASGTGNIPSFAAINTGTTAVTAIITVTPTYTNVVSCVGTPVTFTITVNPTATGTATPATQTICSGTALTAINFSGPVAGTTYTWTRNNTVNVTGLAASGSGTSISGTLTNTTTAQQTVTFTIIPSANGCTGAAFTATVIVQAPLTIICPGPIVVNAAAGTCAATVTFAATVTGTPAPTVTYSPASGGSFPVGTTIVNVIATNSCGTVTCSFSVTVLDVQVPVITTQPVNQTVCVGANANFSVVSTFATSYQWQSWNGSAWVNIPGTNSSSFTVSNVTHAMNTNTYRVIVTGPCGATVTSTAATLYVNPLPTVSISSSIAPQLLPQQLLTLTAVASPSGGTYTWFKDGVIIAGATASTLGPLDVSDAGIYRVIYTDPNGCIRTSTDLAVTALLSNNLYIYPNPSNGQFNVRFYNAANEEATVTVHNYLGAIVFQKKFTTGILQYSVIDVDLGQRLAIGTYLVDVRNSQGLRIGVKLISIGRQ